jgi:hypothetical protein
MRKSSRILPKESLLQEMSLHDMLSSPLVAKTMNSYAVRETELMKVIKKAKKAAMAKQEVSLPKPPRLPKVARCKL